MDRSTCFSSQLVSQVLKPALCMHVMVWKIVDYEFSYPEIDPQWIKIKHNVYLASIIPTVVNLFADKSL